MKIKEERTGYVFKHKIFGKYFKCPVHSQNIDDFLTDDPMKAAFYVFPNSLQSMQETMKNVKPIWSGEMIIKDIIMNCEQKKIHYTIEGEVEE